MAQGMRVVILGADSIERPIYGGEQRSYWLKRIYADHGIDHAYLHGKPYMAYFRPAKRGLGVLLDPLCALHRRVPLELIRKLGHRPHAASALHARLDEDRRQIAAADVVVFDHPFAYPFFDAELGDKLVVYSSHNVESRIIGDYFRRIQPTPSERLRLEERIARTEDALTRRADLVIACTEGDARHYRAIGAQRVVVAANGALPLPAIADPALAEQPFERFVLYVSSAWNPNVAGLIEYCGDLDLPEGRGLVCAGAIGRSTYPGLDRLRANPSISFTGVVENERIAALAHFATAIVIPTLEAGGSNIKTAQAMLTRKPIIATPAAFRGYEEFKSSAGIQLCESPSELQEQIAKALEREPLEFTRPEAGRARWPNALRPAETALLELIAGRD